MISKEQYDINWETSKLPGNKKFENIIDDTGDFPIEERMAYLLNFELTDQNYINLDILIN